MKKTKFSKTSSATDVEELDRPGSAEGDVPIRDTSFKETLKETSMMESRNSWFVMTVFLLVGTSGLIGWNALLNMLRSLIRVIYEGQGEFTDTMTATYFTFLCIVTLLFSHIDAAHPSIVIAGLSMMGILCVVLALICTFASVSAALVAHSLDIYCSPLLL